MKVLQVNTQDQKGGTANVAYGLYKGLKNKGHSSWMAVGLQQRDDQDIFKIENNRFVPSWRKAVTKILNKLDTKPYFKGRDRIKSFFRTVSNPGLFITGTKIIESFYYPGTRHILEFMPDKPDLINFHNLHGNYFDLRILPYYSKKLPCVLTLHDMWLFTGYCKQSFGCDRWLNSCIECPIINQNLVKKSGPELGIKKKRKIYKKSKFHIVTPSKWLMNMVEESILAEGIKGASVIPNGIDLSIFTPGDKKLAKEKIGLETTNEKIFLVITHGNFFRNIESHERFFGFLQDKSINFKLIWISGEIIPDRLRQYKYSYIPFISEKKVIVNYYQAADFMLHFSRGDTFPLVVEESMACATPVVASKTGGIPEQIRDGEDGLLFSAGEESIVAERVLGFLESESSYKKLSAAALKKAKSEFDFKDQLNNYLELYKKIVDEHEYI
ncbi:MAG: glycosyltransferase [Candidatus Omnitrophota bacterium]